MQSQSQAPPAAAGIDEALARNRAFASGAGHEGVGPFPTLRLCVVTCIDPRVDPAHVLGLELGEAVVLRNGGGRVTSEVIENVAFVCERLEQVVPDGPLFEVAVIHHTHCAAVDVVDPFATVAGDVEVLRASSGISSRVTVSGHVYDVGSGLVTTVVPAQPDSSR